MFAFLVISTCLAVGHALPLDDKNIISNTTVVDDEIDLSSLGDDIFGSPSIKSGEALEQWDETSLMNPEEMGEYAEGDILFPVDTRNGRRKESHRWTDGIIPYTIKENFSEKEHGIIMEAITYLNDRTCLHFIPRNNETDYIAIQNTGTGCWSSVGRRGGSQRLNLQSGGCLYRKGTTIHELLHAAGFMHEHKRPERDLYVEVNFNNIKEGKEHNFVKAEEKETNDFGVSYDYTSVMHYSEYAFSKNKKKTIIPKVEESKIGQRDSLSPKDIEKISKMYNCEKQPDITLPGLKNTTSLQ